MFYGIIEASGLAADKIIVKGNFTYICRLLNWEIDKDIPIEKQNKWNIQRIEKESTEDEEITTVMYPNGNSNSFDCNPTDIEKYTYQYRK